jgi:hypothetical protein
MKGRKEESKNQTKEANGINKEQKKARNKNEKGREIIAREEERKKKWENRERN